MTVRTEAKTHPHREVELQRVAALLGGEGVLRHLLRGPLDTHEMLLQGLPGEALTRRGYSWWRSFCGAFGYLSDRLEFAFWGLLVSKMFVY